MQQAGAHMMSYSGCASSAWLRGSQRVASFTLATLFTPARRTACPHSDSHSLLFFRSSPTTGGGDAGGGDGAQVRRGADGGAGFRLFLDAFPGHRPGPDRRARGTTQGAGLQVLASSLELPLFHIGAHVHATDYSSLPALSGFAMKPQRRAMILYTSGTTGRPEVFAFDSGSGPDPSALPLLPGLTTIAAFRWPPRPGLLEAAHKRGIKVVWAIGCGWPLPWTMECTLLNSSAGRTRIVQNLTASYAAGGADGFNIDVEG